MTFNLRSARIPATHRFITAFRFFKAAFASRFFKAALRCFRYNEDAYCLLRSRIG